MFGFDVLGARMLPVQVIFDQQGPLGLEVIGHQIRDIFKEGAQKGYIGAAIGAVVGAAIGIVTGGGIGESCWSRLCSSRRYDWRGRRVCVG